MDDFKIATSERIPAFADLATSKTGCFVFYPEVLKRNVEQIIASFQRYYPAFILAYSVKANSHPLVLSVLKGLPIQFEAASEFELQKLLDAGIEGSRILVNCPVASLSFRELILQNQVMWFVDSLEELEYLVTAKWSGNLGLRLKDPKNASASRFGITWTNTMRERILWITKNNFLKIKGFHCHYYSKDRSEKTTAGKSQFLLDIIRETGSFFLPEIINLGGGFAGPMPVALQNQFGQSTPNWSDYAKHSAKLMADFFADKSQKPVLMIEPGVALAADCIDFLAEVIHIKRNGSMNEAVLNTGLQWLKPTGHAKDLVFEHISCGSGPYYESCRLSGNTCMENDIIGYSREPMRVGDRLLFRNMGAYTLSFGSDFIMGKPQMISIYE